MYSVKPSLGDKTGNSREKTPEKRKVAENEENVANNLTIFYTEHSVGVSLIIFAIKS